MTFPAVHQRSSNVSSHSHERNSADARSCAHAAVDPAEMRGVAGGRFHQGQERDPHGSGLWRAQTQFRGAAFLGPEILRQHGRARRRSHPRLHPQSGEGRSEAGADEPLALTSRLGRLQIQGPRKRPLLPLRAAPILKPPALPGDTYPVLAKSIDFFLAAWIVLVRPSI